MIIEKLNSTIKIKNLNNIIKLFINGNITDEKILSSGDIIFIAGIYIYYFDNLLCVSNYNNLNNYMQLAIFVSYANCPTWSRSSSTHMWIQHLLITAMCLAI